MNAIRRHAARRSVWLAAVGLAVAATTVAAQEPRKSKDVDYSTDKFTGAQYWETTLGNFGDQWKEELTVRKVITPLQGAPDTSYWFIVLRYGRDWAFLRGPSLWLVDGERLEVGGPKDGTEHDQGRVETNEITGVLVKERAYYHGVTPAFLEHLATSQSAEFRFPGERDAVEGKLNKKARERLRRFLDAVVTPGER